MNKWDENKLEEMTKQGAEFSRHKLDYIYISQNFDKILEKVTLSGDVLPLEFLDIDVAYNGSIKEDYIKPEVSEDIKKMIEEKEANQKVMHLKHFSRSITHEAWFDFIDGEVDEFIEKYPEFISIIKK